MLFHVTQRHTPDSCPLNSGGSRSLYDAEAEGVTLVAAYGAYAEHTMYYVLEADDIKSVHRFLLPGFGQCVCDVTPVAAEAIVA
ncbi:hypothetical protein HN371_14830 [Candidatus Poribacteria bacterium]|jgi:hypothetical protein|nr:hypothetical protein [Candidatus Poribacteria bacterium]MBT5532452.1 hypothetical protein [Candidatus Poribacteria bacterium]MBT5709751.1 hypothetical protein [Candidatus Poribacteria bacterium]MBT7101837.1 hypothetical protein [Candidatus Poribacteria bacterium]MBT7807009.1 hypothetical protein [Candidatus Poribacteria bacterium]